MIHIKSQYSETAIECTIRDLEDGRGRGIYAGQDINAGQVVETSPIITMERSYSELPQVLRNYVFGCGASTVVALGVGSLFNHADDAALSYEVKVEEGLLFFIARQAIKKGEELTINYNHTSGETSADTWFAAEDRGFTKR